MAGSRVLLGLLSFCFVSAAASASPAEEEEGLAIAFGNEEFISIATGSRQLIARAPAVASVITAEDIKAMGATDLDQVLETVPGLHVSVSHRGYSPLYTVRGIYSENNPQVLLLINDIPITNVYIGNRGDVWGGMPLNNIARIEVIRGPGSAVYGADAFAGTINIVTKAPSDIDGTEAGVRAGSFDSREGWLLYGGRVGGFDTAFSLELQQTDGHRETIDSDAQSGLDLLYGTSASLASGPVNLNRENIDTRLDMARGDWRLRLGFQGRRDVGTGAGVAQALDPAGSNASDRINADLTFHSTTLREHWDVTAQISYFDTSAKSDLVLFPPGAFGGAFPSGMIGNPDVYERHTRLGLSAFYQGLERHKIRLAAGLGHHDMYKTEESKNFAPSGAPLGGVVDVSNDPNSVFIRPHDRHVYYLSLQDEWSMAADWDLTAGVRYDQYSDFGNTVNPRLALVWQTHYNLTSKFLYGRAFRAPSFQELYNINNPVALGNPALDPEIIDTTEIAFDYRPTGAIRTGVNLFYYRMKDIVRFVPDPAPATTVTARNTGDQTGYGLELEFDWDVGRSLTVRGNYAYQDSTDEDTDRDVANAPRQQVYLQTSWGIVPAWRLNAQLNWVADRKREAVDTRPAIDDYTTVDLSVRRKTALAPWELAVSVRNLFNADAREPSLAPGSLPNDLPLAGRSIYLEALYHLSES